MNETMRKLLATWEKQTYAAEQIDLPSIPTFEECLQHPGQNFVMFNKLDSRQTGKWIDSPFLIETDMSEPPALPAANQVRQLRRADESED